MLNVYGEKMENKFNVIVVGGGPAGVAAAVAAARHGQKVLLLERDNALGGAIHNMLVLPFMRYYDIKDGKRFYIVKGIFGEICDRYLALKKELEGEDADYNKKPVTHFNDEYMKIVFAQIAKEAGVQVLYHALFLSAECENNQISKITAVVKGTQMTFSADAYIDCSGDAEVAFKAGFPTRLGRPSDNMCQPMTLCFRMGNVDMDVFRACDYKNRLYEEAKARGEIDNPREDLLWFRTVHEGIAHFNTTRIIKKNPVDPIELSEAEEEGRKQTLQMFRFLRKYAPGCEKATLISTAAHIGVRESRMIDGEYILTGEDVVSCTKFDDGIAACNYDVDIHSPDGAGTSHHYFKQGTYYTIPYRCLVPKDSKNLLVAGRCISSTHEAQASYRVIPFVAALGEAAGVAAAIAIQDKVAVKDADTEKILSALRADGAFVEKEIPEGEYV